MSEPSDSEELVKARAQVAEIDNELAGLLLRRAEASSKVQQLRIDAGGTRISITQEGVVRRRWQELLGDREVGTLAAELVLLMGRGKSRQHSRPCE